MTVLFTNWPPYCLFATGIVGLWLMQNAFSAGPLHSSLPTIAAGEPVAGIALGIVVFGDRIQISPAQLAIEAGGIAALIVGVVMVARSTAFSGLRKITEVITPHGDDAGRHHDAPHTTPADLSGLCPDPDLNGWCPDPYLNGRNPGPDLDQAGGAARARRMARRPLHGPASGGEGG